MAKKKTTITKSEARARVAKKKAAIKSKTRSARPDTQERTVSKKGNGTALIPLKAICSKLGIDANCATREKLRRVWRDEEDGRIGGDDHQLKARWLFTPEQAKVAERILAPAE